MPTYSRLNMEKERVVFKRAGHTMQVPQTLTIATKRTANVHRPEIKLASYDTNAAGDVRDFATYLNLDLRVPFDNDVTVAQAMCAELGDLLKDPSFVADLLSGIIPQDVSFTTDLV